MELTTQYHLPVMSECDADCRLCGALGCLRPARLTDPEFLQELDVATLSGAETIVFPPNFLNHPEAPQFCAEVSRRRLTPLVRLRPRHLTSTTELLRTLEYRGATFEVIVAEPVSAEAFHSRLTFRTVFIPSRWVDPSLLYDSLPFSWRANLEVLAPLSSVFEAALSPDELYLFLSSQRRPLRPYRDVSRTMAGRIPGAAGGLVFQRGQNEIRLSCLFTIGQADSFGEIVSRLNELAAQTLETRFFEIVIACDRVSNEVIDGLLGWAGENENVSVQIRHLADCWGDREFRQSQGFNLAAIHARGSEFLFLSRGFPIERDFLVRCSRRPDPMIAVEFRKVEAPARHALYISARRYFDLAGFPELEQTGFEFEFMIWKASRLGQMTTEWFIGDVDRLRRPVPAAKPKSSRSRSLAAQAFYLGTLDSHIYRSLYPLMGSRPRLRRAFRVLAKLGVLQGLMAFGSHVTSRVKAARLRQAMRVSMRST